MYERGAAEERIGRALALLDAHCEGAARAAADGVAEDLTSLSLRTPPPSPGAAGTRTRGAAAGPTTYCPWSVAAYMQRLATFSWQWAGRPPPIDVVTCGRHGWRQLARAADATHSWIECVSCQRRLYVPYEDERDGAEEGAPPLAPYADLLRAEAHAPSCPWAIASPVPLRLASLPRAPDGAPASSLGEVAARYASLAVAPRIEWGGVGDSHRNLHRGEAADCTSRAALERTARQMAASCVRQEDADIPLLLLAMEHWRRMPSHGAAIACALGCAVHTLPLTDGEGGPFDPVKGHAFYCPVRYRPPEAEACNREGATAGGARHGLLPALSRFTCDAVAASLAGS